MLPLQLMKIESRIMIDGVLTDLCTRFGGVPFLSVHDAILCPHELVDEVEDVIQEKFQHVLGTKCNLKTEAL
jgi:hypothetical protein